MGTLFDSHFSTNFHSLPSQSSGQIRLALTSYHLDCCQGEQQTERKSSKKLSLKDYKAKKEAERARQSTESEENSEPASQVSTES